MPTVYTEAIWRAIYKRRQPQVYVGNVNTTNLPPITYGRDYEWFQDWNPTDNSVVRSATARRHDRRKDWLTGYGLDNNARTIHIGAAFGFLMEYLIDVGISDVWGIEPSPYVWANTSEIRADVLPRIVNATVGVDSTSAIQSRFAAAGMPNPRRGDWIVDEDAIPAMSNDTEIAAFLTQCEELLQGNARSRIVHLVTPLDPTRGPGDTSLLWKTMTEWQAYAPTHTWVDAATGVVT